MLSHIGCVHYTAVKKACLLAVVCLTLQYQIDWCAVYHTFCTVQAFCDAMQCYAMLCYAMLCYVMLCYAMLCYAMLCYAVCCFEVRAVLEYDPPDCVCSNELATSHGDSAQDPGQVLHAVPTRVFGFVLCTCAGHVCMWHCQRCQLNAVYYCCRLQGGLALHLARWKAGVLLAVWGTLPDELATPDHRIK